MNKRLRTLIDSGHLPHAVVIDGSTYEERLSLAYSLASAVICESSVQKPCGNCTACKKVKALSHPDVITVLPEEGKKNLSVKIVRNMREDAFLMPNEADRKVYIIAKGEAMQDEAQNALLKILEEPPKNVMFIILCPSHSVLLATVLSRVAVFSLNDEPSAVDGAADAEAYDDVLKFTCGLCDALTAHDEFALLRATSSLEKNYEMLPNALDCFELILRDALVISSKGTSMIGPAPKQSSALAAAYDSEKLFKLQKATSDIVRAVDIHSNKNLTMTRLVSLLASAGGNT